MAYRVLMDTPERVERQLNELVRDAAAAFKATPEIVGVTATRGGPHIGPAQLTIIVRVQDLPAGGLAEAREQSLLSAVELGRKAERALQITPVPTQIVAVDCYNPACVIHGSGIEEGGEG
jgi:hypothetical protein